MGRAPVGLLSVIALGSGSFNGPVPDGASSSGEPQPVEAVFTQRQRCSALLWKEEAYVRTSGFFSLSPVLESGSRFGPEADWSETETVGITQDVSCDGK